jgi:hypothetical protein
MDEEPARAQSREEMIARMKRRIEQARKSGQSADQIEAQLALDIREEMRQQVPHVVAQARSWWSGFRNFLIVGALAFAVALGLALLVEHRYAAPLCEQHAARQGLLYQGLEYPRLGRSTSTSSSARCMLINPAGLRTTVSLSSLEANPVIALAIAAALEIEFTTPVAFVLIALVAVAVLKIKPA